MSDLRPDLERLRLAFTPPEGSPERFLKLKRRRQVRRRVGTVLLAFVVASFGFWAAFSALRPTPEPRPATPASTTKIAFVKGGGDDMAIYLVNEAGGSPTFLALGHGPAWSPDGKLVAYWIGDPQRSGTDGAIRVIASNGSDDRLLIGPVGELPWAGAPSWSPDGSSVAFAANGIHVIGVDGTGLRLVTRYEGDRTCADLEPSWSPDGSMIAFALRCEGGDEGIWTVRPDGTERRLLLGPDQGFDVASNPAWSPDGSLIVFAGARTSAGDSDIRLYLANADGTEIRPLGDELGAPTMPSWSSGGDALAFFDWSTSSVKTIGADGTGARVVADGATDCCPAWQPTASSGATPSASPTTGSPSGAVTATFHLPSGGRAIAGGDGAGWASLNDRLVRIDATTSEIRRVPLDPGPYSLAVIGDSVWAAGYSKDEGSYLKRLDPATGSAVATIPFPGSAFSLDFSLLAGDGSSVWVAVSEPTGLHLVKIDPQTNTRTNEVSVGQPPKGEERQIIDLVSGGGSVWALVRDLPIEGERVDNTYILQINPNRARIVSTLDIPNVGSSIVYMDGKIWASFWETALEVDPTTGDTSKAATPGGFFHPMASDDGVWFVESSQADGGSAAIAHLDTVTQQVDVTVPLPIDPSSPDGLPEDASLDPQSDTAWVLIADGSVLKVNLPP